MFCNFDCASLLKLLCGFFGSADVYTHIKYPLTAAVRGYLRVNRIYFTASSTATATATVAPTMGLLPMPRKPIIST